CHRSDRPQNRQTPGAAADLVSLNPDGTEMPTTNHARPFRTAARAVLDRAQPVIVLIVARADVWRVARNDRLLLVAFDADSNGTVDRTTLDGYDQTQQTQKVVATGVGCVRSLMLVRACWKFGRVVGDVRCLRSGRIVGEVRSRRRSAAGSPMFGLPQRNGEEGRAGSVARRVGDEGRRVGGSDRGRECGRQFVVAARARWRDA